VNRIRNVNRRHAGFTLVELIVVIVLVGIIGGMLALQLAPAIRSYLLVSQRANLTSQADTALRRIVTDVRSAVPNSLRLNSSVSLDLVPTRDGGRYRAGPDIDQPGATRHINEAEPGNVFDVLTPFKNAPRPGDAIVIGNRSPADVYGQSNVAVVNQVTALTNGTGLHRIELEGDIQVPPGYDGGRFVVVPDGQRVVTYLCDTPGRDQATGSGTGRLLRIARNDFGAPPLLTAPDGAAVVATRVEACSFMFYANQGATQDSGYIQLQLTLTDKGESVPLTIGAYVDNQP